MQSAPARPPSPVRIVLFGLLLAALGATGSPAIEVGDTAPEFHLADLDGLVHSLSGYAPNPVLLHFLECDAQTSIALAPLVQSDIYEVYVPDGLRMLGIECSGGGHEQVGNFRNQTGVRFPLLLNGEAAREEYELEAPSFVLVGGGGTVRYVSAGAGIDAYDRGSLSNAIEESLRESNDTKEATWGLIKSLYSD